MGGAAPGGTGSLNNRMVGMGEELGGETRNSWMRPDWVMVCSGRGGGVRMQQGGRLGGVCVDELGIRDAFSFRVHPMEF